MRFKRLSSLGAIAALSITAVLTFGFTGVAHAAGDTCTWTGDTDANFSTTTNWSNCSSAAPVTGDSLIFDNTSVGSTGSVLTDDITGVTYDNITFQGSGSTSFNIINDITDDNTLSVSGNITDSTTVTGAGPWIDIPVTLTETGNTVSTTEGIEFGDNSSSYDFNLGTNNVTFSGNGTIDNYEDIIGSGTITVDMGSSGVFIQEVASPSFTGAIDLTGGTLNYHSVADTLPDMFNNASGIQISSGATLAENDSLASDATIAEPITAMDGTGVDACTGFVSGTSEDCGAVYSDLASGGNLTLSGAITLTGDSQLDSNDTITLTGPLSGDYTVDNAYGTLVVDSSNNTSGTPNGTYNKGTLATTGTTTNTSSNSPKTPNTGSALTGDNIMLPLAGSLLLAAGIYFISRKAKYLMAARRR
jgi:hypothetical protein